MNKLALANLNNNAPFYIIKAAFFHSAGRFYRSSSWPWGWHEHEPSLSHGSSRMKTISQLNIRDHKRFYYYSKKPPKHNHTTNNNNNNNNSNGNSDNNYKNRASWNSKQQAEDDKDDKSEFVKPDLKERIALGLSGSGPLSLEDVKNAYRACALRWHPDRHKGSSKAIAAEKFKVCSAAYQSLCVKLAEK
ncbi:putative DnaJ domain, Chaperone J-domain superfamily [Helianthus anomalus]